MKRVFVVLVVIGFLFGCTTGSPLKPRTWQRWVAVQNGLWVTMENVRIHSGGVNCDSSGEHTGSSDIQPGAMKYAIIYAQQSVLDSVHFKITDNSGETFSYKTETTYSVDEGELLSIIILPSTVLLSD